MALRAGHPPRTPVSPQPVRAPRAEAATRAPSCPLARRLRHRRRSAPYPRSRGVRVSGVAEDPRAGGDKLRLLPWTTPEGKPCYLSTDSDRSMLSLLADEMEAAQLRSGAQVLVGARAVLADAGAGERAVRFALTRASESLEDVIRIATSRGERIGGGER